MNRTRISAPYYRAGRLKVIMAVAALLFFGAMLALAGCGGGTTATTAGPAITASQTASWPSARAIADQIGATNVQPSEPTLYASEEVTAVWHGRNVSIATFASVQLRENWVRIAEQFTPIMTVGPQFAIADLGPAS